MRQPNPFRIRTRYRNGARPLDRKPSRKGGASRWSILVLLPFVSLGCTHSEQPSPQSSHGSIRVEVASLEPTPIREQRIASGTVEPWQRVSPGTKIMGRISQVTVDIGDRVEKGQLLARLEDADLRAAVEQARAAIAIAEARLSSAESQYHRMSALADRGSATTRSLEDATSSYQIALASLQQAKADLSSAEATLQYSEVRSPITGFVVAKNVEIGGMAGPGQPFFTIENTAKVKVTAQVAESDIVGLAEGDTAHVDIPVVERSVEATVSRVVPAADPASRTFDVEVHLDNPDQAIKSGMFARISFPRGERQALLIPSSALVTRGQLDGVYVVDGQRARLRWVRLGREFETMREVLSGLEPGEVFVVSIPEDLTDGSQVETTS